MTHTLFYLVTLPFEAACHINILPKKHPASQMHGHSYHASIRVKISERQKAEQYPIHQLKEQLQKSINPLDYSVLNNLIDVPTDENLARWIHQKINLPDIDRVAIQSTHNSGVDLDNKG
ncbi:MAG: 6-carboxytetrahydropterin synthase, partial [Gammaproteobacteria bacterium]|nr:6-carboxytetrahydropterin synthase [Gammaproteobacteria bacterium]